MPTQQQRSGRYEHPLSVVSAALWDKYNGHKYVKDVWVLERRVDERGRLHSRRLLTMLGSMPKVFAPIFGNKPFHLVEDVVVDLQSEKMEVRTRNINFVSMLDSSAESVYRPSAQDPSWTDYDISVRTSAFPGQDQSRMSTWGIGRRLEEFVAGRLLGNIKQGEQVISDYVRMLRHACYSGEANVYLCRDVVRDRPLMPPHTHWGDEKKQKI